MSCGTSPARRWIYFVAKLDVASGMRVVTGARRNDRVRAWRWHGGCRPYFPLGVRKAGCAVGVPGGVVALVVSPVHDGEVGGGKVLPRQLCRLRESADQEQTSSVWRSRLSRLPAETRSSKIVPATMARPNTPTASRMRRHRAAYSRRVPLQTAIPRLGCLTHYEVPWRQVRIGYVVHTPTTGCSGDGDAHDEP